jgi:hypothetical protein
MAFVRPPLVTNMSDCWSALSRNDTLTSACHGHGVCQSSVEPAWCACDIGFDSLTACALPFYHSIAADVRIGVFVLAVLVYVPMLLLFGLELAHHVAARRALKKSFFPALVCGSSLIMIATRVVSYCMLASDFLSGTANLESAIWITSTVGLSFWGVACVLCSTTWLDLILRAKTLNNMPAYFRRCKKANLVLVGVFVPLGIVASVLRAANIGPSTILQALTQFCTIAGVVVPILIAIVCLCMFVPFLRQLGQMRENRSALVLRSKTLWFAAVLAAVVIIFMWVIAQAIAFDSSLPSVVMLNYYMWVATDVMVLLPFWVFAQQYAFRIGPGGGFRKEFLTFGSVSTGSDSGGPKTSASTGIKTGEKATTSPSTSGTKASTV